MKVTGRPAAPTPDASIRCIAHDAPSALNAGRPSRLDLSLASTRPTPSDAAAVGSSTSGVGPYPSSVRWNAATSAGTGWRDQRRSRGFGCQSLGVIVVSWSRHDDRRSGYRPPVAEGSAAAEAGIRPTITSATAQAAITIAVPTIATGRPTVTDSTPISGG